MTKLIPVLLLVLVAFYPLTLLFLSVGTVLQVDQPVKIVGVSTPIRVVAVNAHGVRDFSAYIEQGGVRHPVYRKSEPASRWLFYRGKENPRVFVVDPGTRTVPKLKEGKAKLTMEAVSNDLRAKTDRLEFDVDVNTQPPVLRVDNDLHYMNLGGSSVVTFEVGGFVTESGVRVGGQTFASFPWRNKRVSFFAVNYDTPEGVEPVVFARNPSGAEAAERIRGEVKRREFRRRDIEVDESFMTKVITELDPAGKGDDVARFTKVNNDMRQANNQRLSEMRLETAAQMLWNGPFLRLSGSSEAQFCDYRTYFYKGQSIDKQVHLGFDLAGMSRMPAKAANDGKVIYAAPLGIFGKTVVLDHGLAVQSLYAHLSEFAVKPGEMVKKGQMLGRTGATGMAGGDHLHFTMLVGGVQVDSIEWWDPHWIDVNVMNRLK